MRNERSLGLVCHGDSEVKYAGVVLGGEDEVVFAVFLHDVVVPHLLFCPGHLVDIEDDTVVGHLAFHDILHGKYVIVAHLEMTAVVVETLAAVPVV